MKFFPLRLKHSIYLIALGILLSIAFLFVEQKIDSMYEQKYLSVATDIQKQIKTLINEKKNATLAVAMTLSKNKQIVKAFKQNTFDELGLDKFSLELRKQSDFNNVWFQIINDQGTSLYRSWSDDKGDNLQGIRQDIHAMYQSQKPMTQVAVGQYDVTFQSMVPLYQNKKFIGILEVITHFNSIYDRLLQKGIQSVILADKKYTQIISKPFSKKYVDGYYVANKDAQAKYLAYLEQKGVENTLHSTKNYLLDEDFGHIATSYTYPNTSGEEMLHCIGFIPLNKVDLSEIQSNKNTLFAVGFALFIALFTATYYVVSQSYLKQIKSKKKELEALNNKLNKSLREIKYQRDKSDSILNSLQSIVLLSDGEKIQEVNQSFFDFFSEYESLIEFKKEHACICDYYEFVEDETYITQKTINGKNWLDYILSYQEKTFKVCMKKQGQNRHFIVHANQTDLVVDGEYLVVVSYADITHELQLQEDILEKDRLLFEKSKMASMGEMLSNIAHQWRQPLSVVSTIATGMKMKLEYDIANKEDMLHELKVQNDTVQKLSTTIDDFRNFFKKEKKKNEFQLQSCLHKTLDLMSGSFESNSIKLHINCNSSIVLYTYENELIQALLNILGNAKEALLQQSTPGYIFIDCVQKSSGVSIIIRDNAGGIEPAILDKIFEPYFTTKHKSQGTGIGLYMTKQILQEHIGADISIKNSVYMYNKHKHYGVEFEITFKKQTQQGDSNE